MHLYLAKFIWEWKPLNVNQKKKGEKKLVWVLSLSNNKRFTAKLLGSRGKIRAR